MDAALLRIPAAAEGTLAVRRSGAAGSRPLVFLHGYSLSSEVWRRQLASRLADRYDLIAPDLRGCGDSTAGTGDLTDEHTWAGDVAAVLDALRLDRPILIAWSYGGLILGDYLTEMTDSGLAGIVLIAAAPLLSLADAQDDDPFFSLIPDLLSAEPAARAHAERRFVRRLSANDLDQGVSDRLAEVVARVPVEVRRAMIERTVNHLDAFARVRVPTLILHGGADVLLPPVVSDLLASTIRHARTERFAGLGHSPFLEDADGFNDVIDRFASSVS